jgi:uncharacterized protein (TIGR03435 family)
MRISRAILLLILAAGRSFAGQTPVAGGPLPSFDVASVKVNPNPPRVGARVISLRSSLSHGTLTFEALTLTNLILQAYDLQRSQIVGCPNWCDSDFFDVIGKAEDPNASPDQVRLMLQSLLVDRFKLNARKEKRENPGYALVIGKGGSKLKPAKDEEVIGATVNAYVRSFQKMPIAGLVNFLSGAVRQPVVDETGLKGAFNFTIDLTPENSDATLATPAAPNPASAFARLSSAVEDQLGLRLEPRKISVENLVIASVQKPSEN